MTELRATRDTDLDDVCRVHRAAFGDEAEDIEALVRDLLCDDACEPRLSLAAFEQEPAGAELVGHVLFTPARIEGAANAPNARILAPLAVSPRRQQAGLGSALVREGLRRLRAAGVELVFVYGDPRYYGRFGFRPASVHGLPAPNPIPTEHADAWMVLALGDGVLGEVTGRVRCVSPLERPEHW